MFAKLAGLLLSLLILFSGGAPAEAAIPPAPTSAVGFTALWKTIPTCQWGAADVSLSVPRGTNRAIWLYGDTMSGGYGCPGRFVHSSAIFQYGGTLHVSRGGAQVLPNDSATNIYWISKAWLKDYYHIYIQAAPMRIGAGAWNFSRRYANDRLALVNISSAGDLTFAGWVGWRTPPPAFNDFTVIGPHHFTYENRPHPEWRMASGKTLWTKCQNWDDGILHTFPAYRPIFYEK